MPKYLIEASYTPEGLRGLKKDKASGRKKAIEELIAGIGGKVEAIYYAFGEVDVFVLIDAPDPGSAAALSLTVSASGLVRIKTTPLLTVEETDQALSKTINYKGPGA